MALRNKCWRGVHLVTQVKHPSLVCFSSLLWYHHHLAGITRGIYPQCFVDLIKGELMTDQWFHPDDACSH